nr:hypothetical protein [uncultured Prevotella sp.]
MKKLLFLAIATIMSLGASAQLITSNTVTYKKSSGYNRIGVSYNSISSTAEGSESVSGVSLAWTKGISVAKDIPLFVETGLGATYAFDDLSALIATIPLNVTYKWPVTESIKIAPLAGLTFNGNITSDVDDMKFFTLGWQAGVNVELGKFYVGLSYGGGLTDFVKYEDDYESYNYKLNNFAATIGLVF